MYKYVRRAYIGICTKTYICMYARPILEKERKEKKRKETGREKGNATCKMKTRERKKAILVVDLGSKRKRRERRYRDLCTILIS